MVIISLLFGGGSLALGGEREDGNRAVRITRLVAIFALVALGTLTVLETSDVEIGPRWFGVASVAFLLSLLSLPFLRPATDEEGSRGG